MVLQRCNIHPRGLSIAQQTRVYQLRKVDELQGSRSLTGSRTAPVQHTTVPRITRIHLAEARAAWASLGPQRMARGSHASEHIAIQGVAAFLKPVLARCRALFDSSVASHIAIALGLGRPVALDADMPRLCPGRRFQKR